MGAGAPIGNKNAEKWTIENSTELLNEALLIASDPEKAYDFTGRVYLEAGTNRHQIKRITDKFPELKLIKEQIDAICEANCYDHGKKGDINHVMALGNLNANHGWSNKTETTTKQSIKIEGLPSELDELLGDD